MKCSLCGKEGADQAHAKYGIICEECRQKQPLLCDFCSEVPYWRYPVKTFNLPEIPGHRSVEDWAACDICKSFIEGGHWWVLARRSLATQQKETGPLPDILQNQLLNMIIELHKKFKENKLGPPEPIGGEK